MIVKDKLVVEKKDKKLNFMAIDFSDINESFALKFSNTLVSNVIKFYTKYKTEKIEKNVLILQKQADSVKAALFGSINNVARSVDLNLNPSRQIVKTQSQKENIDLTISQAVLPEILKQLEISKIALRKETPLIQIVDSPVLPLKKTSQDKRIITILIALIGTLLYTLVLLIRRK
jgi:LPS O-antigen subunit length determinant protein (WzzB/FepE family)